MDNLKSMFFFNILTPVGSAAFIGLGGYSYWSGHRDLTKREGEILRSASKIGLPARRMGVTFTSAVLVGLGLYRFFR